MDDRPGRRDGLREVLGRSPGAGNRGAHRARWWALGVVAALLVALTVLATPPTDQAAAQTATTFISNTGQTSNSGSSTIRATAFGTGTGTHTLSSVGIYLNSSSNTVTPDVKIYGDTGGSPGTTPVATLTNPDTLRSSAVNFFTAPDSTTLSANTTYWLVTSNSAATNGRGLQVGTIANTNPDSGTAAGWTIGNARFKNAITDTSWNSSSGRLRFQIRGTTSLPVTNAAPTATDNTVTTSEDTDHTFAASEFNFADTDTDDTLSSVKIVTLPATGKGTLELNGTAIASADLPKTVTKADIDADKLKYSPPANANGSAYTSFTFKVNDGEDDSASANTLTIDVTAVNDPATGVPTITGTVQVGQALTAVTTGIMDIDGLTNVSYAYQWFRVDGATETEIDNAHFSAYILVAADEGKTIKVRVGFFDNDGTSERRISAATAAVSAASAQTARVLVSNMGRSQQSTRSITSEDHAQGFTTGRNSTGYTLTSIEVQIASGGDIGTAVVRKSYPQNGDLVATLTGPDNPLGTGAQKFTAPSGTSLAASTEYFVVFEKSTGTNGASFSITESISEDAGGAPHWSINNRGHTRLVGSTGGYTAVIGKNRIRVNGITKSAVVTNSPPTASDRTVTTNEDTDHTFAAANFNFADTDTGDTLSSVKIVTLPGSGKGTLELDGTAIASTTLPQTVTKADIDANKLKYSPPANANGSAYASFTFKVNDGTDDSASANTMTIDVTAVNDAATGAPTITGTVKVGQTLTAVTTGIMDVDGLTSVTYTYQWIRVDGSDEDDITGATSSTYTLVADDQGKTIKVKVSFTDDGGTAETRTSAATATVAAATAVVTNAAPTASDNTVTTNEDTDLTFAASEFNFADTDTGDTLSIVKIVTLPGSGKGTLELDGTAIASADLPKTVTKADIDASKLKYSPPANANGSAYASFTFKVNDGTDDSATANTMTIDVTAVNDAPTASDRTVLTTEDILYTFAASEFNFADTDTGDTLSIVKIVTLPGSGKGTLELDGTAIASADLPKTVTKADIDASKLKYSPPANANGSAYASFTFKVNDGTDDSATANTMTIDVTAVNDAPTASDNTVTTNEDTDHTFAASEFNFADTDTGDTLSSVKIVTLPGSGKGTLELDGTAITSAALPQTVTKADIDANKLKYSPPANANGSGYASFTFKVNDGDVDSATANTMTIDVTAVNDTATGEPTITGTVQVGQTLTAVTAGIMDADGLTSPTYTYQWIRVEGATETDISGATSSTYTLVAADDGKRIKVKVSFTDDDSNPETLTSAAQPQTEVWSATLTVQVFSNGVLGCNNISTGDGAKCSTSTVLTEDEFTYDGATYTIDAILLRTATRLEMRINTSLTGDALNLTFDVAGTEFAFQDAAVKRSNSADMFSERIWVVGSDPSWAAGDTVALKLTAPPPNNPATGAPTIIGTAQERQTLTADTSAVMDADGLTNVSYSYQWIRVDADSTERDITHAISSTYTLVEADVGKTIRVRVSFTDELNRPETLTSTATEEVTGAQEQTQVWSATLTVQVAGVGLIFGCNNEILVGGHCSTSTVLTEDQFTYDGTTYTIDPIQIYQDQLELRITPPLTGNTLRLKFDVAGTEFAFRDADTKTDDVRYSIRSWNNSGLSWTVGSTVALKLIAPPPNNPATGVPTISGTVQVGQTLTAATTGFMDADGLTNVSYAYQWIRWDGDTETDIPGATSSTYTLVEADQGKTIRVRVSFTDDDSNLEALTSTATVAVTAAPTITGTVQVGRTLTADTSSVMDADGLNNVSYTYQWIRVDGATQMDIPGATSSTYTLVEADQGKRIKARVSFTDDAGHPETRTSTATVAVAAGSILVSNLEGATNQILSISAGTTGYAQSFQTGERDATLVTVWLDGNFRRSPRVSIHSDSSGEPGTRLRVLQNPSNLSRTNRLHEFSAGNIGLTLKADTPYWMVMDQHGHFGTTLDDRESGVAEWSIGNTAISQFGGTWRAVPDGRALRMELLGEVIKDLPGRHSEMRTTQGLVAPGQITTGELTAIDDDVPDGSRDPIGLRGDYFRLKVQPGHEYRLQAFFKDTAEGSVPLTTGGSIGLAFYNIGTGQQAGLSPGSDHNRDDGVTIVHFAATGGREYYVKVNVYDQYNGSKSTKYHGKYHLVLTDITGVTLLTNNMIFDAGDNATVRDKTVGTTSWGISFIAGTHSAWYKIDRLQLFIEDTNSNATPVVTIRATSGERPGDALCTFVGLNGYASGIRAADEDVPDILYPDPDNCDDLEADYRYWVVMEAQDTTKSYKVGTLVVTASVTGPAADWIISGTVMEKDNSTTTPAWSRVRPDQHILFRLWGTPKTSSAATAADPPTVSGAPAVSDAGSDGEWTPDETVEVTFTFSEAVTVDATGGTPSVGISLGGSAARSAAYLRGSGTTELTFGYTLTDADGSHSAMIVTHNSLALNGGTIRSQATSVDADLSHAGKAVTGPRSQNSGPKGADKQPANTPATGLPTISGTVQVGQVLTADTSAIADTDGLTLATFAHQWIAGTADISGATGSSHTLTSGEQGRSIKVKVTFTDDAGNSEELISAATFAVAPPPLTATIHDAPDSHDGQTAFTFRLRLSEEFGISYRTLRDHAFTVTGGEVIKAGRLEQGSNVGWEITVEPDGDGTVTIVLPVTTDCDATGAICTSDGRVLSNSSTITVPGPATQSQPAQVENSPATGLPAITGTATVGETLSVSMSAVSDENGLTGASHSYQWVADDVNIQDATGPTHTLTAGDEGKAIGVRVSFTDDDGFAESVTSTATAAVAAEPNTPATGLPTISGTVQVAQVLTADTSAIADQDGLSGVSYDYQWIAAGSNISGATGSSYTLTSSQQGQTIRVRVTFTDDRGHQETLTSAATGSVAAAPSPLTAYTEDVPESHDGQTAFTFELRFSEEFSISYKTLRDHAFTVTGGEVIKARRLEKGKNVRWEIHVRPDSANDVTIVLPATTDCDAQGAVCTEGRKLSNRLEMTVSGP